MNQKLERIKKHFIDHKIVYCAGLGGVVVGVSGALIFVCGNSKIVDTQKLNALINWKSPMTKISQITMEMPARGHRGNVIYCNETQKFFSSQGEAARVMGIKASNLSAHLNGRNPHVGGNTFQSLGENLSEEVKVSV